jgi:hypothetical protein
MKHPYENSMLDLNQKLKKTVEEVLSKKGYSHNSKKREPKYKNTKEFVNEFMRENPLKIDGNGFFLNNSGEVIRDLNFKLLEFYDDQDRVDIKNVLKTDMHSFLDNFIYEFYEKEMQKLKKKLDSSEDPTEEDSIKFEIEYEKLKNIIFPEKYYSPLERKKYIQLFHIGFYNYIWQVKTKIDNKPYFYNPITMVFSGSKQRTGKTSISLKLSEVFKPFVVLDAEFEVLSDMEHHYQLWRDNLVIICDDLEKNEKKCLGKVKKNLTNNYVRPRMFYKQSHDRAFKRATVLGTSNKSVGEVFSDPSGTSRFLDIPIKPFKIDIRALNKIDMLSIVKMINVPSQEECFEIWEPLYEKYIYPYQSENVMSDILGDFIEFYGITVNHNEPFKNIEYSANELWKNYKKYCDILGYRYVDKPATFRTILAKRINAEIVEKRTAKTRLGIKIDISTFTKEPFKEIEPDCYSTSTFSAYL